MKTLTVLLADDHPIVVMGVREIIERDGRFKVVGQAHNSTELVQQIKLLAPDVVITDYNMPGDETYGDGNKLVDYLGRNFPRTRIIVLTMISNSLILSSLYKLGVAGIVLKSGDLGEILLALDSLSQQSNYRSPAMDSTETVLSRNDDVDARITQLSPKEFEVLRHFVSGLSVGDIAVSLNRSIKTVSSQKVTAMRKLGVDSDSALLMFCIKANLFQ